MKSAFIKIFFTKPALQAAAITALCGLVLWGALGETWVNASYDYLFRFGSRSITNQVVLVLMDDDSYEQLHQKRGAWDRELHARLLNKLTEDHCSLAVFDVHFGSEVNAESDRAVAGAMRRNGRVVLMASLTGPKLPGLESANVSLPQKIFLDAVGGHFGIGKADAQTGAIARRHWPFYGPGEGSIHSLGWAAAEAFGATLDRADDQQWLRYYGENGPWQAISYHLALSNAPGFFRDKIVFIGNDPKKSDPGDPEEDKFLTPYTRWNGKAVGGMEIMATTFLNLVNGDWLRRPPAWIEIVLLVVAGTVIGAGFCHLKPFTAVLAAVGTFLIVTLAFVSMSYFTNYWFPWLVIAGGQAPCALVCAWVCRPREVVVLQERFPGYTTVVGPFGKGSYGRVWLVRDATGQLMALKEIERAKFQHENSYEREFRGIRSYKPISSQHLGLLHIDHVNRNDLEAYFYYVMELGDALDPDWQQKGEPYMPRDLDSICRQWENGRLVVGECIRIGIELLEPLHFLHQQGLVHRDIKPSNIIFVKGRAKLADVGLVRDATPEGTDVGTPGYMPRYPEPPGTVLADIYAMGMVLYVVSSGKQPSFFPDITNTLVEKSEFMRLNEIICKACQPAAELRYASAAEMLAALREAQQALKLGSTRQI
ncbi:MAG TPA: CHASE2 domain-containing protein [Verrucomicrobiae bacterium]|nr:CHASE2 domain-containing protein [Verrucomicrobiae bacterium]